MSSALSLAVLLWTAAPAAGDWCYESNNTTCADPSQWHVAYPKCAGNHQSPVDVVTKETHYKSSLKPFTFEGYDRALNVTVKNLGHAARFDLPESGKVAVQGGDMTGSYKAVQFHLHWGADAGPGAEHTFDGERYPMELHIVHVKEKYRTLKDAMHDSAGVVVLAFFFEKSSNDNSHYDVLIGALGRVRNTNSNTTVSSLRLDSLLPQPEALARYYYYTGSLTTPECDEVVTWALFQEPILISATQLTTISQKLLTETGAPMKNIFRPMQPLNDRTVFRSRAAALLHRTPALWLGLLCVGGRAWLPE